MAVKNTPRNTSHHQLAVGDPQSVVAANGASTMAATPSWKKARRSPPTSLTTSFEHSVSRA